MNKPASKGRLLLLTAILVLMAFSFTGSGCRLLKRDKQSIAEKKQGEADKKATAEYEKARKQHYTHQSKEAKKMMKRTQKQASKFNKPMKRKAFSNTKCN
jgi:type VI protein secretion system component VasK